VVALSSPTNDLVLTAAHCFDQEVLVGASIFIGITSFADSNLAQQRTIAVVRRHPDFLRLSNGFVSDLMGGDQLLTAQGPSPIAHIASVLRKGYYAPMTYSGRLVVNDGAHVSVYATLPQGPLREPSSMRHWLTHAPHRLVCRLHFATCQAEQYDPVTGLLSQLEWSHGVCQWLMSLPVILRGFGIAGAVVVVGLLTVVEHVVDS